MKLKNVKKLLIIFSVVGVFFLGVTLIVQPLSLVTLRFGDSNYAFMPFVGSVYYVNTKCIFLCETTYITLNGVDSKNFTVISRNYAKSKEHVYYGQETLKGVSSVALFSPIVSPLNQSTSHEPLYFIDKDKIWFIDYKSPLAVPKLDGEANFNVVTFSRTSHLYLVSNKRVFMDGFPIPNLDPMTVRVVTSANGAVNEWLKDSKSVFVNNLRVVGADPDTIVASADNDNPRGVLAYDAFYVYYMSDERDAQSKMEHCREAVLVQNDVTCDADFRLPNVDPTGLVVLKRVGWGSGVIKTKSGVFDFSSIEVATPSLQN